MFNSCTHHEISSSLELIRAPFAIFEIRNKSVGSITLVSANTLFEDLTDKIIIECVGLRLSEFLPRYVEKQIRNCFNLCMECLCPQEIELIIERNSKNRWWRFMVSPLISTVDFVQRFIVTMIEITDKKNLEAILESEKQRFAALVDSSYDGIITINENQKITMINEAARDIFLVGNDYVLGDHLQRFIPDRFRQMHALDVEGFRKSAVKTRPMQSRSSISALRKDGAEIPVEVTISKIIVGNNMEMTAVIRDRSEQTKLLELLQEMATHDPLTGIYNRRYGETMLISEIHRSQRFKHFSTIAMLDIDCFKMINDTYGHPTGDNVLRSFVDTVLVTLRDTDVFCRWGGEEFLVILPETSLDGSLTWAEKTRHAVSNLNINSHTGETINFTVSIGVAAMSFEDISSDNIIKRVDTALYRAKNNGRNQVVVFSE